MYLGDGLLFELQNGKPKLVVLNQRVDRNNVKNSLRTRPRGTKTHLAEGGNSFRTVGVAARVRGGLTASKTWERPTITPGVKTAPKIKSELQKSSCTSGEGTSSQTAETSGPTNLLDVDLPKDVAVCSSGEEDLHDIQDVPVETGESGLAVQDELAEGGDETTRNEMSPQETVSKSYGGLVGWLEQRDVDTRVNEKEKKARWLQQLNAQMELKQQQCLPSVRLQVEEEGGSERPLQLRSRHREQPAAIRSSLRLGAVTPEEEAWAFEKREEQRKLWLEDLDRQKEESSQRRRREKILLAQEEDHQLWAAHFDSMQRKAPVLTLPPAVDREPSPTSSTTGDGDIPAAGGGAKDASKSSYLRSMTALLDPIQMEERERRRLKQLQQQKDIQAQVEERQKQKREEEARRKEKEEEEERKVVLERDALIRRFQQEEDKQRERGKEQPKIDAEDGERKESLHGRAPHPAGSADDRRDTAVQTDTLAAAPSTCICKAGKENTAAKGGPTLKTEKTKPGWNKRRPDRRFIPASERYPATLQRSRQESRLKRQEEMLGLQERNCQSRKDNWKGAGTSAQRECSPPNTQPSVPEFQFIPYIRTEDVIHSDPTQTPFQSHKAPSPQRQQEILRGLQQLRQGLLQKQKELESDLRRGGNQRSAPSKSSDSRGLKDL
ncbi:coiled-coil domain-containing protein 66 [Stigmatopora argus]